MALEPAGVSLQAQGFNDYIKKLDTIEKKNRAVFDQQFKGTGKSFAEVTKAANAYEKELKDVEQAQKKAAREAEKLAQAQVRAANKARAAQEKQRKSQVASAAAASQARRGAVGQIVGGVGGAALAGGPAGLVVAGIQKVIEFRKESIELSKTQAAAEAQLAAAIKSTGGAAGLTSKQLIAQAAAFQEVTNFGDETTIAAQAQLLTFTKIGGETFPRATKAILDLATRMDGDLKGATIQVGKALNDPVAGLSALSRSGVQFSEAQKELVKGFVETNDIAAAQSVILKELETQFGGSAEAARAADEGSIALGNAFGDLQEEIGEVFRQFQRMFKTAETGIGIIGFLTDRIKTLQQVVAFAGAGFSAFKSVLSDTFDRVVTTGKNIGKVIQGEATDPIKSFSQILDTAGEKAIVEFKELATVIGETFDEEPLDPIKDDIDEAIVSVESYKKALKSAEQLQLSFARSAEDAARKLARANEDIARKQGRQVNKLEEKQAKDREKILDDQIKERENFEKDGLKEIANAEKDIAKERAKADESRLKAQKKLQDKLRQQEERFRLSQLQGSRRFALAERRLRAEGDILALQELREDRELTLQEEKENFNATQKETIKSGKEQINEQEKVSGDRVNEIKERIEKERAELLTGFDTELADFQQKQIEERANLQAKFAEQAEDRKIALAREEEDRRISQARQLEDLGRSLAEQEGVTKEGSEKVALALEEVFGIDGSASNIMTGFTAKTESEFRDLFDNLNEIVTDEGKVLDLSDVGLPSTSPGRRTSNASGIPRFQEPGTVPGPLGSPQLVIAEGGERFLGADSARQNFAMTAPVIPSQTLNVAMSGGFNITGGGEGNEEIIQAATTEMVESIQIAVNRLARRN